jgi:hypothetical protein
VAVVSERERRASPGDAGAQTDDKKGAQLQLHFQPSGL